MYDIDECLFLLFWSYHLSWNWLYATRYFILPIYVQFLYVFIFSFLFIFSFYIKTLIHNMTHYTQKKSKKTIHDIIYKPTIMLSPLENYWLFRVACWDDCQWKPIQMNSNDIIVSHPLTFKFDNYVNETDALVQSSRRWRKNEIYSTTSINVVGT